MGGAGGTGTRRAPKEGRRRVTARTAWRRRWRRWCDCRRDKSAGGKWKIRFFEGGTKPRGGGQPLPSQARGRHTKKKKQRGACDARLPVEARGAKTSGDKREGAPRETWAPPPGTPGNPKRPLLPVRSTAATGSTPAVLASGPAGGTNPPAIHPKRCGRSSPWPSRSPQTLPPPPAPLSSPPQPQMSGRRASGPLTPVAAGVLGERHTRASASGKKRGRTTAPSRLFLVALRARAVRAVPASLAVAVAAGQRPRSWPSPLWLWLSCGWRRP